MLCLINNLNLKGQALVHGQKTINYNFYLNKLIICCLILVSKVVVYGDLNYEHAE